MTRCTIGIRGQAEDPDYPVQIWFDSIKSMASVLSDENQALLYLIEQHQPDTLAELAQLTGRASSNLSRTLKTLERHHLVRLEQCGKKLKSEVMATEFIVVINK